MMIGIISDTHGLLRPEALRMLAHVDHIIHGGDIGRPEVTSLILEHNVIVGRTDAGWWS